MLHARYVLAFDTALNGCSAALFDVRLNKCTAESQPMQRGQAEHLVPMIDRVLDKAGVAYKDIEVIGVTIGPGAFTGLRIGLSAARALGLALDRPALGITTFEAIARQYLQDHSPEPGETLAVLLDTKRADFYVQFFAPEGYAQKPPASASMEDVIALAQEGAMIGIGDGIDRFRAACGDCKNWQFVDGYGHPDPGIIAKITASKYGHASKDTVFEAPQPLYLRPPDVSTPKKKLRILVED